MVAALGVALVVALPGMTAAQDEAIVPAEDVHWLLDSYDHDTNLLQVPEGVRVTLLLSGGEANGLAGCNSYFGSYEIDETSLSFGPLATTMMLCEAPAHEVEEAYLALLAGVAGWSLDETTLQLTDESGQVVLEYGEAEVDLGATGVGDLALELSSMQAQLDALGERIGTLRVSELRDQIAGVEASLRSFRQQVSRDDVPSLRQRLSSNDAILQHVSDRLDRTQARLATVEERLTGIEARIDELLQEPAEGPAKETSPTASAAPA